MKAKLLNEDGQRTFVLVFDTDDEVADGLLGFAREHRIESAQFTGIGALRDVTFAFFEWTTKEYEELQLDEQLEVLTLAGDIAFKDGKPAQHAHLVVGKRDGTAPRRPPDPCAPPPDPRGDPRRVTDVSASRDRRRDRASADHDRRRRRRVRRSR